MRGPPVMPRGALVWPLRVASQVGDPSIARRVRWTLQPLAPASSTGATKAAFMASAARAAIGRR
jgi:hypothetical protein